VKRRALGRGRASHGVGLFLAVASVTAMLAWPVAAMASHHYGNFPYWGVLFMSRRENYSGNLWITSTNCNEPERIGFNDVHNSTVGTSEMPQWADGIHMTEYRCDGGWDFYADIQIKYMDQANFRQQDGSYIGGRNVNLDPGSGYCAFWGTYSPCGVRPQVQINADRYFSRDWTYRAREIMHETGHSMGLDHHCSGNSIMNNGASDCNGGAWYIPLHYYSTDRWGIQAIYP
jgi:hypothetical protein